MRYICKSFGGSKIASLALICFKMGVNYENSSNGILILTPHVKFNYTPRHIPHANYHGITFSSHAFNGGKSIFRSSEEFLQGTP